MTPAKIRFGGIEHTLKIPLGIVPDLETETGLGVLTLARQLRDMSCTTAVALAVIRVALAANGKPYTSAVMYEYMAKDGLVNAYTAALAIITKLFEKPEQEPGKGRPAKGGQKADAEAIH